MAAAWREPRKTGTERVMCLNGCASVHMTTASIRRDPLPLCGGCGDRMWPEHPDLAAEVMPEDMWGQHPWLAELTRQCSSVARGQAGHVQRGRRVRGVEDVAMGRVARSMRDDSRARRRAGLVQFTQAADAAAAMPF